MVTESQALKYYIGCKQIGAVPMTKQTFIGKQGKPYDPEEPDQDGYMVVYSDSYQSWSPADVFESAYLPMGDDNTRITEDMVKDFCKDLGVSKLGEKTTMVQATLRNGFQITESSSCVEAENYNQEIGAGICVKRIQDKVWMLLGFLLQSARKGIS